MKIVILGCGVIAESHTRILNKIIPNAHICLCDIDRDKAEALGERFKIQETYTNFDQLLNSEKPDAIHILTPPTTHASLAEKAILAGCHVLIEKPVAETAEEFKKISDLAREKNKILSVDYSTLGMPVILQAKREIASGRFGRIISVHCNYATSWSGNSIPYGDPKHWSYFLKGGILQNWADHPASLILDFLDPIEEHKILFAHRNILPLDCPDLLHVMVRNQDQIGSFTLSLGHGNTSIRAYFILEAGSIFVDIRRMLISYTQGKGQQNFIKRALSGITEGYSLVGGTIKNSFQVMTGKLQREPGIINVIDNFYKTISAEEELLVNHDTVFAVTKLLEDVWKEIDYKPVVESGEAI